MNRQDIREKMQLSQELWVEFIGIIFPGEDVSEDAQPKRFSPCFLVSDETGAKAGKTFPEDLDFPEEATCESAFTEAELILQKRRVRETYSGYMSAIAKPYSSEERETWFKQQEAAKSYALDQTIEPYIQTMADGRGIDVVVLLGKIQENIDLYNSAIFDLLGKQQKALDELDV